MLIFHSVNRVLSCPEKQQLSKILASGLDLIAREIVCGGTHHAAPNQQGGHHSLSERQREILFLIQQGKTNQNIAEILHISLKNVKYHIERILDKLEATNRTQAVAKAIEFKIPLKPVPTSINTTK